MNLKIKAIKSFLPVRQVHISTATYQTEVERTIPDVTNGKNQCAAAEIGIIVE
jgi:hypothetical protein